MTSVQDGNDETIRRIQDSNNTTNDRKEDEDADVAEMERLLAQQEEEDEHEHKHQHGLLDDSSMDDGNNQHDVHQPNGHEVNNGMGNNHNNNDNNNNDQPVIANPDQPQQQPQAPQPHQEEDQADALPMPPLAAAAGFSNTTTRTSSLIKANYTTISIVATIIHILYVLRTRKQIYLALMFLTTSRVSYILIGNTVISCFISLYQFIIKKFLGGLRLIESESISDSIRWGITETVFALTMFRQEVNVKLMGMFLVSFWLKALHWAVELRGSHLRMTEEVFYFLGDEDFTTSFSNHSAETANDGSRGVNVDTDSKSMIHKILVSLIPKFLTEKYGKAHEKIPRMRKNHLLYWMLMNMLYSLDLVLFAFCSKELIESGPSASILFLFEAAIMLITVLNSHFLYGLHVVDGCINVFQRLLSDDNEGNEDGETAQEQEQEGTPSSSQPNEERESRHAILIGRLASFWRDNRATANFSVELMALAAKFLLHLIYFGSVFATYGLPLSIIRDFYMAYLKLRRRLSAFVSYRRLTSNMEKRFKKIESNEELDEVGHTCIICRDTMDVNGIHGVVVKLPMCGHAFHKHCLREWLVQQQSCPTCRADIQANEARAVQLEAAEERRREDLDDERNDESLDDEDVVSEEDGTTKESFEGNGDSCQSYKSLEHPTLYRAENKVLVVDFLTNDGDNGSNKKDKVCQKVQRVLNEGTIVVCTDVKLWVWNELNMDDFGGKVASDRIPSKIGARMFLKIPDGWIRQTDLKKMLVLSQKSN